jgi:hypothetical protein
MSTASPSTNFDAMPQFEQSLGREKSGHAVQLYSDDAFLLEILTGFIGGALSAGDGALSSPRARMPTPSNSACDNVDLIPG